MTFSSTPYTEFQLNKYDNKAAMTDHIRNINYGKGSTYTDRALQLLVQENFQEKNGARKLSDGHPHVAIVITDGKSENVAMTKQRAQEAKDQDVTIIAVGIGMELNQQELKDMASSPSCQHVMTLVDFNEFTSLQDTLSKKTCEAPVVITIDELVTGNIGPGQEQNCKMKIPPEGATVRVETSGGPVEFLVSDTTYPNADYFDQKISALPGQPAVLYINFKNTEGEIYCRIRGNNLTEAMVTMGAQVGEHDYCKDSPCKHGTCIDTGDAFKCDCSPGFSGDDCSTDVDECADAANPPCKNGGTCTNTEGGFTCACAAGFSGKDCGGDVDECADPANSPCKNGGTCTNTAGGYSCTCAAGFKGENCDQVNDLCADAATNPCKNGGGCSMGSDGNVVCTCKAGLTGKYCTEDVNECADPATSPCKNGGTCTNKPGSYSCTCKTGYEGTNCDQVTATTTTAGPTEAPRGPTYSCDTAPADLCANRDKGVEYQYFKHPDPTKLLECAKTPSGTLCREMQLPGGMVAEDMITWDYTGAY
jgi:hypothetical protein